MKQVCALCARQSKLANTVGFSLLHTDFHLYKLKYWDLSELKQRNRHRIFIEMQNSNKVIEADYALFDNHLLILRRSECLL